MEPLPQGSTRPRELRCQRDTRQAGQWSSLYHHASGDHPSQRADQSSTGKETPKEGERQGKDKDDARPKTTTAPAAAGIPEKPTTKADSTGGVAEETTSRKEKAEDVFPPDGTSAALECWAAADVKKEAEGKLPAAEQNTPQQREKAAAASAEMGEKGGSDVKLPEEEAEKAKDRMEEKEGDREAVGKEQEGEKKKRKRRRKRMVGEEQEEGIGGLASGLDQRKQLLVNVVVASLVVFGLGFYIATKLRSDGNKE